MKIVKYKKASKGRYKIFLENEQELLLYEEVILKFNLLLKKTINEQELKEIDRYNQELEVYYFALNSINNRIKSVFQVRQMLNKKEYPENFIEIAIKKLKDQGYLNDKNFAKSFIHNQMIVTNKGPRKIERELMDKKIDLEIIKKELEEFSDEKQLERIRKLLLKMIKSNHTRSGFVLKRKIFTDIKNLGYDTSLITEVLNNYEFKNDDDLLKKEYEKLFRKLNKKYSGEILEKKIKEKLYQKGFTL